MSEPHAVVFQSSRKITQLASQSFSTRVQDGIPFSSSDFLLSCSNFCITLTTPFHSLTTLYDPHGNIYVVLMLKFVSTQRWWRLIWVINMADLNSRIRSFAFCCVLDVTAMRQHLIGRIKSKATLDLRLQSVERLPPYHPVSPVSGTLKIWNCENSCLCKRFFPQFDYAWFSMSLFPIIHKKFTKPVPYVAYWEMAKLPTPTSLPRSVEYSQTQLGLKIL